MIRAASEVREPRGVSWQNWAARCKDVIVSNKIRALLVLLVLLAVLIGSLYLDDDHGHYAKHVPQQPLPSRQLNINDSSSTLPPAAAETDNTSHATSVAKTAAGNAHVLGAATVACNQAVAHVARLTFQATTTAEDTYHAGQLRLLATTGPALNLLSTSTSSRINQENIRHHAATAQAGATLHNALQNAHCL